MVEWRGSVAGGSVQVSSGIGDYTLSMGLQDRVKEIPDHQDGPGKYVFFGSCECF